MRSASPRSSASLPACQTRSAARSTAAYGSLSSRRTRSSGRVRDTDINLIGFDEHVDRRERELRRAGVPPGAHVELAPVPRADDVDAGLVVIAPHELPVAVHHLDDPFEEPP